MSHNNSLSEQAEVAYNNILRNMAFYVNEDDSDSVYVEYITSDGITEFKNVKDAKFGAYVRTEFRKSEKCDNAPSFQSILQKYIDSALLDENKTKILSRMGGDTDETAYFLADRKNSIIVINKGGYKVYNHTKKYKFLKSSNVIEQVEPKRRNGLVDELKPFLNMDEDMQILFTVNIVQEFLCTSSHFLAVVSSQQGSGKSTFTNMWRRILDPAQAVITTMPDNADSLKNHLANKLMVCFDNTQQLNSTYSDILCGAVTGTSYTRRKLYTDNEEIVMKLHNIVVLNGIDVIPKKSDLLERSLLFRLNKIDSKDRKTEKEIKDEFEDALPYILGAIFDTLVEYFKMKDSTKIIGSHRMAGAYNDCYIISKVLGVEREFIAAFSRNQQEMQTDYAETNPVISAMSDYMNDISRTQITDSISNIYDNIKKYADVKVFPKSPSAFSRELNNQKIALEKAGYRISIIKKKNNSSLTIRKMKGGK